jgi:hypothetical protein
MNQQTDLLKLILKTMDINTVYEEHDSDSYDSLEDVKSKKNVWGTNITNVRLRNIVLQRVIDCKNHLENDD